MITSLLRSADFKQLASFVSPTFFDVMPARAIWSRGRKLLAGKNSEEFQGAVRARAQQLGDARLGIVLAGTSASLPDDGYGEGDEARATRIVALYFEQLFSDTPTLLDLRPDSFREQRRGLTWSPAPWVCSWDPGFAQQLRALYLGFYRDDGTRFRAALEELGIGLAEDLFRKHFGAEQAGQKFVMRDFVDTFHQVFVRCRDNGVRLHPDFLPLGVYLATMYEHLEKLGARVDVRACFERFAEHHEPTIQA